MKLKEFDYVLPKNLIAQKSASPRDHSRLLILDRRSGRVEHRHFYDLPDYLRPGDVLVLNDTKVMPARLYGRRAGTGGRIEVFLLKKTDLIPSLSSIRRENKGEVWQCLVGGHRRREGLAVEFDRGLKAEILKRNPDNTWLLSFNQRGEKFMRLVQTIGLVPLPPYIKRDKARNADKKSYQTVFAAPNKVGSVAAPTAGLHFTPALLEKLKNLGVEFEYVTLHVGLGTFAPVKSEEIEEHQMHEEYYEISGKTLTRIIKAKAEGRRIVAVGTTSARVLEAVFSNFQKKSKIQPACRRGRNPKSKTLHGSTDIFIYPGYRFRAVDALITNFHLPRSTLLMLTCAFAGQGSRAKSAGLKLVKQVYELAVRRRYRFFSYGDAMLIK